MSPTSGSTSIEIEIDFEYPQVLLICQIKFHEKKKKHIRDLTEKDIQIPILSLSTLSEKESNRKCTKSLQY